MNRRDFLKTVSLASVATLISNNVFANNSSKTEVLSIDKPNNFNFVLDSFYKFKENDKVITAYNNLSKYKFYGNKTREIIENMFCPFSNYRDHPNNEDVEYIKNNNLITHEEHSYSIFGYYGNANKLIIPLILNNKYPLKNVIMVMGFTNTVKEIYFDNCGYKYKDLKCKNVLYPCVWDNIFYTPVDKVKQINIQKIIMPKDMYDYHDSYFNPILKKTYSVIEKIEKDLGIKVEYYI